MSSFTISIEPVEGGNLLLAPLAPATAGAPATAQLALKLMITAGATDVTVVDVTLSFSGGPAISPRSYAVNVPVTAGLTGVWVMEPPYVVLSQPGPASITVAVSAQGVGAPVTATWPLAGHVNPVPGGAYGFVAKPSDLRAIEYWSARSAAHGAGGGGMQMLGYDMDVIAWDIAHWTILLPGTSGLQNDHFRIWGKPIHAMAAGTVVSFRDDIPTNPAPGIVFPPPPPYEGNHFTLQHGDELVLYAHFQPGSLNPALLTIGAAVTAGQFLGLAGNSGNSSNPHLHVHAIKGTVPWSGPPRPLLWRDIHVIDPRALGPPSQAGPWTRATGVGAPPLPSVVWPAATPPSRSPMAGSFIDFVTSLIYETELAPNPNHRDWVTANPSPGGLAWLEHHVDRMLAAYEAWLATEGLPPVTPWNGVRRAPWDPSQDLALPAALDGSFTGITALTDLGDALRDRLTLVAVGASELGGVVKAPYSYRYWSYMHWARDMRSRFQGDIVFPTATVQDRDGTPLSATPFADVFNDLHRNWHVNGVTSGVLTPGLLSTAGQRTGQGVPAMSQGEEFLQFHRDHMELFHRWLARTRQPATRPQDMGRPGGWPPTGPPVVNPPSPWTYDEAAFVGSGLPALTTVDAVGAIEGSYHVAGHGQNSDLGPLAHNNYVPRFHMWHGWIDAQWWWREPRFVASNPTTGERTRIFRPVLHDGSEFPEPFAVSIVRDLAQPADTISPPSAVGGLGLASGAGTIRVKLYVRDPLDRPLRLRLAAEVLDPTGALVPASTVKLLRNIGPGGDHALDTVFTEDIALTGAFTSDDPARANAAVGFVHARIRVSGTLWVPNPASPDDPAASPDHEFVHEDSFTIDLIREKLAPEILIYQDLSSFSDDQVDATMTAGVAAFDNAFFVVAQDRTAPTLPPPVWPPLVADEVKGLIVGRSGCSGLFDDIAHPPEVVLWQELVDAPFTGVTVRLQGAPQREDTSLPPALPQRFTWRYAIDFATGHDAFDGLSTGDQRLARLRVTVRDRAGNADTTEATVKLFRHANPYVLDGATPWLSVDTRSFAIRAGETRLGETLAGGQPLQYLEDILDRLNAGTTGAETFDTLATEGPAAALEYAEEIPDFASSVSTAVYNFALAKVRLRGSTGADGIRAFFRLFRYAEPSLVFSTTQGYRSFDDGAGRVVALLGFESETAGAALRSIPFFAAPRVDPEAASFQTQDDPLNVHDFPLGPTAERVWYFGAWLDFNDPDVRMPATYNATAPDGPYSIAALEPLQSLMRDFHQCMVVEIRYDGDPTEHLASPFTSDNLAQRNLAILTSANPGSPWTRTVEQAFELDLARPLRDSEPSPDVSAVTHEHGHHVCEDCGHGELAEDALCARCGGSGELRPLGAKDSLGFLSSFAFERIVDEEALSIAMRTPHDQDDHDHVHDEHEHNDHPHDHAEPRGHKAMIPRFQPDAARIVRRAFPFVFHSTRWTQTARLVDELMIDWGDLPRTAEARLFLPAVAPETILSLRNIRHAPDTAVAESSSTLRLKVGGISFVPLPPVVGDRLPGTLTITLPDGVRAPSRYVVDVMHLRAGATVRNGGFRVEVVVTKSPELLRLAATKVIRLHHQLAGTPTGDRWRPVLERRLRTERLRARDLAAAAEVDWKDPTVWIDDDGVEHPVIGTRIRVILEEVLIVDEREPFWKQAGEIEFHVFVRTESNGGLEQRTRLPNRGHLRLRSGERLAVGETVFEGFVVDDLGVRIDAMERDTFDPDDNLGSYTRTFSCPATSWIGRYRPDDEAVDPERVGSWQVVYRIERA